MSSSRLSNHSVAMIDIDQVDPLIVSSDVERALSEDLGPGDVTACLLPEKIAKARLLCKEDAVIAGRPWFDACLRKLDPSIVTDWHCKEGDRLNAGFIACEVTGNNRAIISAERSALNFLQTLSGTATTTASYVIALHGSGLRLLDTRKTLPGLRYAQKYAVRIGGGLNHRIGLYDAVMLKENHIRAAGSIAKASAAARTQYPNHPLIIEVENLDELDQALSTGCTRILLDDFSLADMRIAATRAAGNIPNIPLEVSGSVTLEKLKQIADTGVDFVSIGALTKHLHAIDFSLKLTD